MFDLVTSISCGADQQNFGILNQSSGLASSAGISPRKFFPKNLQAKTLHGEACGGGYLLVPLQDVKRSFGKLLCKIGMVSS